MKTAQQQSIIYSVLAATIVCTLFLGFNYLQAQWSEAPDETPPGGNVAAPIHTGSGEQTKGVGGDGTLDIIETDDLVAREMMRSDEYCDFNGNNCFGPDTVNELSSQGTRFYYQRVGRAPGHQTAEHIPPPADGSEWDFCVMSGNRLFQSGPVHSSDYDVSPMQYRNGYTDHPSTSYQGAAGGADCSVLWGGGSLSDYSGNSLPGNQWTILLAEPNPDHVARCVATCFQYSN